VQGQPTRPGETTFAVEAQDPSGNVRTSTYRVDTPPGTATYGYVEPDAARQVERVHAGADLDEQAPAPARAAVEWSREAMRTVVLDDELAKLVEQEQALDQATREALVMSLFQRRKISSGKACELLGLGRMEFVRRAGELGVPVYLTTEEEWEHEKATIDSWLES
jgi:predicted HTH domain antitoxin